ncbi:MAG: peroxidase [Ferruginibacter sp.]|nr:peroxidase [Cytophagales bacterium]
MDPLEVEQMQGLLIRGYGHLNAARFTLLAIREPARTKAWLKEMASRLPNGAAKPDRQAVHLAFTHGGLQKLGLAPAALDGFGREFREGMTTGHRQRLLGDYGDSAPPNWQWGGPVNPEFDLLFLEYAADQTALGELSAEHERRFPDAGLIPVHQLPTRFLAQPKEHFGFRDGVSQPRLAGWKEPDTPENTVEPGEFILGYRNEYGEYPESPRVPPREDPGNVLPVSRPDPAGKDFGRNGTYLVFRQLEQDVSLFWQFMREKTRDPDGHPDYPAMVRLAAKMMGRWPGGAPLTTSPAWDDPARESENDFGYRTHDAHGYGCPIGAHVRRSNPRDAVSEDPENSVAVAKRHRLLRRGRLYGNPLVESMRPEEMATAERDGEPRGLHFICLNANLGRQFEFVQHTWLNNPKFGGLYDEPDPVVGNHHPTDALTGTFTAQREPVRKRTTEVPRFVRVIGGAYFFVPSIPAVEYLANLP